MAQRIGRRQQYICTIDYLILNIHEIKKIKKEGKRKAHQRSQQTRRPRRKGVRLAEGYWILIYCEGTESNNLYDAVGHRRDALLVVRISVDRRVVDVWTEARRRVQLVQQRRHHCHLLLLVCKLDFRKTQGLFAVLWPRPCNRRRPSPLQCLHSPVSPLKP